MVPSDSVPPWPHCLVQLPMKWGTHCSKCFAVFWAGVGGFHLTHVTSSQLVTVAVPPAPTCHLECPLGLHRWVKLTTPQIKVISSNLPLPCLLVLSWSPQRLHTSSLVAGPFFLLSLPKLSFLLFQTK